jgi:hypothetical protein
VRGSLRKILFAAVILAAIGFGLIGRLFAATCDPVTYYGPPLILPCGPAVYVCADPQGVAYLADRSWFVLGCSDDRIAIRNFEP